MLISKRQHGTLVLIVEPKETKETIEKSMFEHAISFEVIGERLFIIDNFNNIEYMYTRYADSLLEYCHPEEHLLELIQQKGEEGVYLFPDEW